MQKIEALIQPSKLEAVKDALVELGVQGMTIFEVRGHGRQKGHTEFYRGREYSVDLLPKVKLELIVSEDMMEKTIQAIIAQREPAKSVMARFSYRRSMKQSGYAMMNEERSRCSVCV